MTISSDKPVTFLPGQAAGKNVEIKMIYRRLSVLLIIFSVLLLVIVGRLVYLQIIKGEKYSKIASLNVVHTTFFPASRGMILDCKGRIIAKDIPRQNICAVPSEIEDINIFAKKLAPFIKAAPADIIKKINSHGDNPYEKVPLKQQADLETFIQIAEIQKDLPGLYLEVQPLREYPYGNVAAHVLGYVGEITEDELKEAGKKGYLRGDYIGKEGIEKQYDFALHGKHGERQELVDASGRTIKTLRKTKSESGGNVTISIDIELQKEVEEILKWYIRSLSQISGESLAGCVLIEDIKTGKILVMASIPEYDPNSFSKGMSLKEYAKLTGRKDYPLLNRAIAGSYPLASTFKMITAAAALQEGICSRYSLFRCTGKYPIGNHVFYCFVSKGHGSIDFIKSISESCDVSFYFMGEKLGIDRLLNYARKFGLGKKTGIDLPGEISGLLPDHFWKMRTLNEPWYTGDTITLSIGQGYLGATPLQLLQITSAVANNGVMYKPYLMEKITDADGKIKRKSTPKILNDIPINPEYFEAVKDGMRMAVKSGTAKLLKSKMSAGAKTGTAENFPCAENPNGRNHNWVAGFAPAYEPKIAFVVFFERSGGLAGKNAVPIAREVLDAYCRHYPDNID